LELGNADCCSIEYTYNAHEPLLLLLLFGWLFFGQGKNTQSV
jgi:hypothetical protein